MYLTIAFDKGSISAEKKHAPGKSACSIVIAYGSALDLGFLLLAFLGVLLAGGHHLPVLLRG